MNFETKYEPLQTPAQVSELVQTATETKGFTEADMKELKGSVRGEVLLRDDSGYERARRVWNGMINRHPAIIVRCAGVSDVMNALKFARGHDLIVSVNTSLLDDNPQSKVRSATFALDSLHNLRIVDEGSPDEKELRLETCPAVSLGIAKTVDHVRGAGRLS